MSLEWNCRERTAYLDRGRGAEKDDRYHAWYRMDTRGDMIDLRLCKSDGNNDGMSV